MLAGTPSRSRLVASTPAVGQPASTAGQLAGAVEDVLAVVEDHQRAPGAEVVDDGLDGILVARIDAERVGDGAGDGLAGGDGRQIDHPHAVAPLRRPSERELRGSLVLPIPPGPTSVTSRPACDHSASSASLVDAPDERVVGRDRLWPSAGTARSAGNRSPGASPAVTWCSTAGPSKSRSR